MAAMDANRGVRLSGPVSLSANVAPQTQAERARLRPAQTLHRSDGLEDDQDSDEWEDIGPFGEVPASTLPSPNDAAQLSPDHPLAQAFSTDRDKSTKPKKSKSKQNQQPVEIRYEGYTLEKADPIAGQNSTWSRVEKRSMTVGEKSLQGIMKKHRQKTRQSAQSKLLTLSSNQQGVINRLLGQRQEAEKHDNAEWILADIQCEYKGIWNKELKKIQVILKRQERHREDDKSGAKKGSRKSKSNRGSDIIDLSESQKPEKKDLNRRKTQSTQSFGDLDVSHGTGLGQSATPQIANPGSARHHTAPREFNQIPTLLPPVPPPPPFAQWHQPASFNAPFDNRFEDLQSLHHPNLPQPQPFQPHPTLEAQPAYSMSDHAAKHPITRKISGRESFAKARRRRSIDRTTLKQKNLGEYPPASSGRESSDDSYEVWSDNESVWSRKPPDELSHDTNITIGSSLYGGPNKSESSRPRYRSHRYTDAEYEPAYSPNRDRRYSGSSAYRHSRPNIHYATTYAGRSALKDMDRRWRTPSPPSRYARQRHTHSELSESEIYDDYPAGRFAGPRYTVTMPTRRSTVADRRYEDYVSDYPKESRSDAFQEDHELGNRSRRETWSWEHEIGHYDDLDQLDRQHSTQNYRSVRPKIASQPLHKSHPPWDEDNAPRIKIDSRPKQLEFTPHQNPSVAMQPSIHDLEALLNPEDYFQSLDDLETEIIENCRLRDILALGPSDSPAQAQVRFQEKVSHLAESNLSLEMLCDSVLMAFSFMESAEFCRDSFIILIEDSGRVGVIKAVPIRFADIRRVIEGMKATALKQDTSYSPSIGSMLSLFGIDSSRWPGDKACSVLCSLLLLGVLSYTGSHCSPLEQILWDVADDSVILGIPRSSGDARERDKVFFRRQSLRCLDHYVKTPVWVFVRSQDLPAATLSISLAQFSDLWGPTYAIPSNNDLEMLIALKVEGGIIYRVDDSSRGANGKPNDEILMHFMSTGNVTKEVLPDGTCSDNMVFSQNVAEPLPDPMLPFAATAQLLIGQPTESMTCTSSTTVNTATQVEPVDTSVATTQIQSRLSFNDRCERNTRSFGRRNTHRFCQMGTYRAYYLPQQLQLQFGVGQYVTGGAGKVWKRRPQSTYKERLLEYCSKPSIPEDQIAPILELRVGLEVSMCTGNARRTSLWNVLVLSQRRALATLENAYKAGDLLTLSTYMTRISKTGFDETDRLQLYWPFDDGLPHVVDVSDSAPKWSWMLKDTRLSACFASFSSRCMTFEDQDTLVQPHRTLVQRCHGRIEKYVGSVLETVVNLHPKSQPRRLPLREGTRMKLEEGSLEMRNRALAFHEKDNRLSRFNNRNHLVHYELLDTNRASNYTLPVCIMDDPKGWNGSVALRLE